jgi:protein subunit release factor A
MRRKQKLLNGLPSAINKEGQLSVTCETSRSQLKNKELAIKKLKHAITKSVCGKEKTIGYKAQ